MTEVELKNRTKSFALRIIKLVNSLPRNLVADTIGKQLLRSGTSVGANYRAACLGKSQADFIAKLGIVQEESDESTYWMELLIDSGTIAIDKIGLLKKESEEITAIITASIITSRKNKK